MFQSGFQDNLRIDSIAVPGFRRTDHPAGPFLRMPRAAGGMLSSVQDIGHILVASMLPKQLGGLLQPRTLKQMQKLDPEAKGAFGLTNGGYALGIATGKLSSGATFVANNGSHTGYNALMIGIPSKEMGLVVLTNSDTGSGIELELALSWLKNVAHDKVSLLSKVSLYRNLLRLVTYVILLLVLLYLVRFTGEARRGERRWSETFRGWDIAKGIALVAFGIALGVTFDSSVFTGPLGGIPPARFVSGEYGIAIFILCFACIAAGGGAAFVGRKPHA
jgi:hypothetical protein